MRFAFLGFFVLLAACTTETIIKKGPAESPAGGEPGSEEGAGESAACTAAPAADVASAKIFGKASIDFAGDKLAFGYVDDKAAPTVQIASPGEPPKKTTWPAAVKYAHYGAGSITTSLGHNGERFGFGWYTERPFSNSEGVWSTMFATVGIDGTKSAATIGNDDYGRSGSDDMVQAREPRVMAAGDGFMLAWEDRRTKEPTAFNVNLAFWGGIYARTYDANGRGGSRDVQIAQPTGFAGFAGVSDGTIAMPIWAVDDGKFKTTLHARPGAKFTPAEAPPAIATFEAYNTTGLAAARGANGTVLVVVSYKSKTGSAPRLGSLTMSTSGTAKSAFATWTDANDVTLAAVTEREGGFVVAGFDEASSVIRVFFLDDAGKRTGDTRMEITLAADTKPSALAVRAEGKRVDVGFVTTPTERSNAAATATAHRGTVCIP